jgi:hypothetical protein
MANKQTKKSKPKAKATGRSGPVKAVESVAGKAWNGAGTGGRVAVAAAAGLAAIGVAGGALVKRARKPPRVLGVPVPRPVRNLSVKGVAKQIEQTGGQAMRVIRAS